MIWQLFEILKKMALFCSGVKNGLFLKVGNTEEGEYHVKSFSSMFREWS